MHTEIGLQRQARENPQDLRAAVPAEFVPREIHDQGDGRHRAQHQWNVAPPMRRQSAEPQQRRDRRERNSELFGIPLPAVPALLGFGALAAHGRGNIPLMLSTMAAVALIVDFAWYELGRHRGAQVLRVLARLSLEPDLCVQRAEEIFARYSARGMLVAKFVPGLTLVLPPLAGVFAVGRVRFAAYELVGVLLWAGTWIGVG